MNQIVILKKLFIVVRSLAPLFFLSVSIASFSQSRTNISNSRINAHLSFLASDSLEGRRTGTRGEEIAAAYIESHFKSSKLQPYPGSGSYIQPFELPDGLKISDDTKISINGQLLKPLIDFFPLSFSAHKADYQEDVYPSLKEKSHFWFIDIDEILNKLPSNPHADLLDYLRTLATEAEKKGSTGIFFYTSGSTKNPLVYGTRYSDPLSIPVIFLSNPGAIQTSLINNTPLKLSVKFQLVNKFRSARNVIGFLNNKQRETIVIGAHFDHLGYGEDGNSMTRTNPHQIHNGADDNASGTSALLELSFILRQRRYRNYNYLFIAFSAEELGLLGSKYFIDHHDQKNQSLKFMINLDMVGRLSDSSRSLTIGGYGTSPDWSAIFNKINTKSFNVRFDSSGTGPSDHTSFYRKEIPVLFYFTGLHSDYHKPSDDFEKINTQGINNIIDHILSVIKYSNNYPITFSKTREQQNTTNTRFSVSLGIMPDYSFTGDGVRVDGVSEGKLAQQIGIKASDIIKKLGDINISSVELYMKALSKFKKGDTTLLEYLRGNDLIKIQITFK